MREQYCPLTVGVGWQDVVMYGQLLKGRRWLSFAWNFPGPAQTSAGSCRFSAVGPIDLAGRAVRLNLPDAPCSRTAP